MSIATTERKGSLDSAILAGSETPNDFRGFFEQHCAIRSVFFNGAKAEKLFRRLVLPTLPQRGANLELKRLPSTSPANTRFTRDGKLQEWAAIVGALGVA